MGEHRGISVIVQTYIVNETRIHHYKDGDKVSSFPLTIANMVSDNDIDLLLLSWLVDLLTALNLLAIT